MRERANLPKKARFEVFKRDAFKCQYCGAEAPSVVLHVDHIHPVADGGTDDLLNLVTSCEPCNLGKGATLLSDATTVEKSRAQMEDLQERREQLDMLLEWRSGLASIETDVIEQAARAWRAHAPGWEFTEAGKRSLAKLVRKFGLPTILDSMQIAADTYLAWEGDRVTRESWETALSKVGGVAKYEKIRQEDPEGAEWLHIQNTAMKRLAYARAWVVKSSLSCARSWGLTAPEAWSILRGCETGNQFVDALDEESRARGMRKE